MRSSLRLVNPSDPILREVIPPFPGDARSLRELAVSMWELMRNNCLERYSEERQANFIGEGTTPENGVGLAANQVGQRVRMMVLDLRRQGRFDGAMVCINPTVLKRSDEQQTKHEGCLTWPGKRAPVTRPRIITAQYTNLRGKLVREEMHDWLARAYQHEVDHLDGLAIFG